MTEGIASGAGVEREKSGSAGMEGIGRVALSRRLVNAAFIALIGLGSSASRGVSMLVGMLGAIWEVFITLGLNGCKPTIPNDFLMFSAVNEEWLFNSLEEGALVHCTKVVTCTVIKNLGIGTLEL